jgi:hypothetical protein
MLQLPEWFLNSWLRDQLLGPYWATFVFAILQTIYASARKPRHSHGPAVRRPSDLRWYLPVFVWGVQASSHASSTLRAHFLTDELPFSVFYWSNAACSVFAGVVIFLVCCLAETVAARRGLGRREGFPSVPMGVVGAVCSVCLMWAGVLSLVAVVTTPARPQSSALDGSSNNSFERTRSAAASGSAGQFLWRAAQLAIR